MPVGNGNTRSSSSAAAVAAATTSSNKEIAIYWDFENVPLPASCSAAIAAKAIVDAVSKYGRITDRRLYYNFEGNMSGGPRDTSSLDSSGFDLVNTPKRNQKETLDKKLIADVLTFAWDSAVRNNNSPCVVLLTSDGDYAYTLSKLRDRGVMTVVMVGNMQSVASILVDTADVALSLQDDVIANYQTAKPGRDTTTDNNDTQHHLKAFCRAIHKDASPDDGWSAYGGVSLAIQAHLRKFLPESQVKDKAKDIRSRAVAKGLVEVGKRLLGQPAHLPRKIITSKNSTLKLSLEMYARLLPAGEKLITISNGGGGSSASSSGKSRTVFVRQIPRSVTVRALVQHFEYNYGVTVRRALMELSSQTSQKYSAHLELSSPDEATILINEAARKTGNGIFLQGSYLGIVTNSRSRALDRKGGPNVYYELENDNNGNNDNNRSKSDSPRLSIYAKMAQTLDTPVQEEDTTSMDVAYLCAGVRDAVQLTASATEDQGWANGGACGTMFLQYLQSISSTGNLDKEQKNVRYKSARNAAAGKGLLELSRRVLGTPAAAAREFVPISAIDLNPRGDGLSPELYLRLLPDGHELATGIQKGFKTSPSGDKSISSHAKGSARMTNTTKDLSYFCVAVDMAEKLSQQQRSGWINAGMSANRFLQHIRKDSAAPLSKEDANARFKKARNSAIKNGLAELGRRQLNTSEKEVIAVPLHGLSYKGELSSEVYLRLLPRGRELAEETHQILGNTSGFKTQRLSSPTSKNCMLFICNFPLDTVAQDVVEFFESFQAFSSRVEMEEKEFKGSMVQAAHVMFESSAQAQILLDKSKKKHLIFRGCSLFACPDRATPDSIAARQPNRPPCMSYAKANFNSPHQEALDEMEKQDDTVSILTDRSGHSLSLKSNGKLESETELESWQQYSTESIEETSPMAILPMNNNLINSGERSAALQIENEGLVTENLGSETADLLGLGKSCEPVDPFEGLMLAYK